MKYIDVIEELSQSKNLHQGQVLHFTKEMLKTAATILGCKRTNAWLFDESKSVLNSINSYNSSTDCFFKEASLHRKDLPNYFNFLTQNKIIVSEDALSEKMNMELVDSYLIPNQIKSMIDVPLRSEGEMVGVICFEAVAEKHLWSSADRKFTQSLAQLLSLAIETNNKNALREELEQTVKQKEVLLYEINHRVKNNMAVIIGLINLQRHKSRDAFHEVLLEELKEKIYSMAIVQNHLHNNKSLVKVELALYLKELIDNIHRSYGHRRNIDLQLNLNRAVIDITKGIPIGLMANEIITNSFKYAFKDKSLNHRLSVSLIREKTQITLKFEDNGPGFDPEQILEGMGMGLIRDLANQIGGTIHINVTNGVKIEVSFPIR
ncbi:MAG: histidine kinase dimerization/phosphoacceptor domain -containing protein [Vicingaceae bacterium]